MLLLLLRPILVAPSSPAPRRSVSRSPVFRLVPHSSPEILSGRVDSAGGGGKQSARLGPGKQSTSGRKFVYLAADWISIEFRPRSPNDNNLGSLAVGVSRSVILSGRMGAPMLRNRANLANFSRLKFHPERKVALDWL